MRLLTSAASDAAHTIVTSVFASSPDEKLLAAIPGDMLTEENKTALQNAILTAIKNNPSNIPSNILPGIMEEITDILSNKLNITPDADHTEWARYAQGLALLWKKIILFPDASLRTAFIIHLFTAYLETYCAFVMDQALTHPLSLSTLQWIASDLEILLHGGCNEYRICELKITARLDNIRHLTGCSAQTLCALSVNPQDQAKLEQKHASLCETYQKDSMKILQAATAKMYNLDLNLNPSLALNLNMALQDAAKDCKTVTLLKTPTDKESCTALLVDFAHQLEDWKKIWLILNQLADPTSRYTNIDTIVEKTKQINDATCKKNLEKLIDHYREHSINACLTTLKSIEKIEDVQRVATNYIDFQEWDVPLDRLEKTWDGFPINKPTNSSVTVTITPPLNLKNTTLIYVKHDALSIEIIQNPCAITHQSTEKHTQLIKIASEHDSRERIKPFEKKKILCHISLKKTEKYLYHLKSFSKFNAIKDALVILAFDDLEKQYCSFEEKMAEIETWGYTISLEKKFYKNVYAEINKLVTRVYIPQFKNAYCASLRQILRAPEDNITPAELLANIHNFLDMAKENQCFQKLLKTSKDYRKAHENIKKLIESDGKKLDDLFYTELIEQYTTQIRAPKETVLAQNIYLILMKKNELRTAYRDSFVSQINALQHVSVTEESVKAIQESTAYKCVAQSADVQQVIEGLNALVDNREAEALISCESISSENPTMKEALEQLLPKQQKREVAHQAQVLHLKTTSLILQSCDDPSLTTNDSSGSTDYRPNERYLELCTNRPGHITFEEIAAQRSALLGPDKSQTADSFFEQSKNTLAAVRDTLSNLVEKPLETFCTITGIYETTALNFNRICESILTDTTCKRQLHLFSYRFEIWQDWGAPTTLKALRQAIQAWDPSYEDNTLDLKTVHHRADELLLILDNGLQRKYSDWYDPRIRSQITNTFYATLQKDLAPFASTANTQRQEEQTGPSLTV